MSVLVIMGVSGSGKTTIAEQLAQHLGWPFQEGDALHPAANVEKMRRGVALTDADRGPWLDRVAGWIDGQIAGQANGVITCSGLKRAYRDRIGGGNKDVRLIYLHGDRATLEQHVQGRHHEYMPATLLDSQLATLEPPTPEEGVIEVDIGGSVEHTVQAILDRIAA